jgi:hypothetical protein
MFLLLIIACTGADPVECPDVHVYVGDTAADTGVDSGDSGDSGETGDTGEWDSTRCPEWATAPVIELLSVGRVPIGAIEGVEFIFRFVDADADLWGADVTIERDGQVWGMGRTVVEDCAVSEATVRVVIPWSSPYGVNVAEDYGEEITLSARGHDGHGGGSNTISFTYTPE